METPLRTMASRSERLETEIRQVDGRVVMVIAVCFIAITLVEVLA